MPYTVSEPPEAVKDLPKHAIEIFVAAFNSAFEQYDGDEAKSNAIAWSAVENVYEKDADGKWVEKKQRQANPLAELWDKIKAAFEEVMGGQSEPAPIDTQPVEEMRPLVIRQKNGQYRWLGIAATAVINRDNMIDSRMLFDSFIKRIQETGEYPIYDVLHLGEYTRIGIADYVMRDGAVYFASGTFDNTPFAQAAARGLAKHPEYWGHSISFLSGDPQREIIYEVEIPVFTDGLNRFISVVPRSRAASMFTDVTVQQRGKNTMDDQKYAELVKLVGEDEAKKKRAELDQLNRTIDEAGLIQREQKPKDETPIVEEPKPVAVSATPVAEVTRTEEPKPAEVVAEPEWKAAIDALTKQVSEVVTALGAMQTTQTQLTERIAKAERPIEEALADAPAPKPTVITRARDARATGEKVDPSDTLNALHAQRARK